MENSVTTGDVEVLTQVEGAERFESENKPIIRGEGGLFKPGTAPGPGRPKGKTLKEFAREWLQSMTPQEKLDFMNKLDPSVVWRMAEGNPHQTGEIDHGFKPIPILSDVPSNDGNKEDPGAA